MTPSIVLVPGSFTLPSFYQDILTSLTSKGHDIQAVALKTVIPKGPDSPAGPLPTVSDDVAVIVETVTELADEGKDVIVVAHSYGGVPASQSLKDLSKKSREAQGKKGGVVRLGYISAVVPAVGQSLGEWTAGSDAEEVGIAPDENGWLYITDTEGLINATFSDVQPRELAEKWADRIEKHSSASFADELTYAGYKDVPVSWLFCTEDRMITPLVQRKGIDAIEGESGAKVDITEVKTGHCPHVMALDDVVAWFEKLASTE